MYYILKNYLISYNSDNENSINTSLRSTLQCLWFNNNNNYIINTHNNNKHNINNHNDNGVCISTNTTNIFDIIIILKLIKGLWWCWLCCCWWWWYNGWLLVSDVICQRGRQTNPYWRRMRRYICVCLRPTQPTCGL